MSINFATAAESNPAIDIEILTNGLTGDTATCPKVCVCSTLTRNVGSTVIWTYIVTNTGDVPLTNVQVQDNRNYGVVNDITDIISNGNNDATLDVGESWTYKSTGVAALGDHTNLGEVVASYASGPTDIVMDTAECHYMGVKTPPPKFPAISFLPVFGMFGLTFAFILGKD
jgi:hypothetical protein